MQAFADSIDPRVTQYITNSIKDLKHIMVFDDSKMPWNKPHRRATPSHAGSSSSSSSARAVSVPACIGPIATQWPLQKVMTYSAAAQKGQLDTVRKPAARMADLILSLVHAGKVGPLPDFKEDEAKNYFSQFLTDWIGDQGHGVFARLADDQNDLINTLNQRLAEMQNRANESGPADAVAQTVASDAVVQPLMKAERDGKLDAAQTILGLLGRGSNAQWQGPTARPEDPWTKGADPWSGGRPNRTPSVNERGVAPGRSQGKDGARSQSVRSKRGPQGKSGGAKGSGGVTRGPSAENAWGESPTLSTAGDYVHHSWTDSAQDSNASKEGGQGRKQWKKKAA